PYFDVVECAGGRQAHAVIPSGCSATTSRSKSGSSTWVHEILRSLEPTGVAGDADGVDAAAGADLADGVGQVVAYGGPRQRYFGSDIEVISVRNCVWTR